MSDYTLGIKEIDSLIGGIKKGSNLMLIGPPMVTTREPAKSENDKNFIKNREVKIS